MKLFISNNDGHITDYKLSIENKGTGPAIIEEVRVAFKDIYPSSWKNLLEIGKLPDSISTAMGTSSIGQRVISSNENFRIFSPNSSKLSKWLLENNDNIKIEIYYKSVFDEYWIAEQEGFGANTKTYKVYESPFLENEIFNN